MPDHEEAGRIVRIVLNALVEDLEPVKLRGHRPDKGARVRLLRREFRRSRSTRHLNEIDVREIVAQPIAALMPQVLARYGLTKPSSAETAADNTVDLLA